MLSIPTPLFLNWVENGSLDSGPPTQTISGSSKASWSASPRRMPACWNAAAANLDASELKSSATRPVSRSDRIMVPRLLTQRSASFLPPATDVTMSRSTSTTCRFHNLQHQRNLATTLLHVSKVAVTAWFARIVRASWILTHLTRTSNFCTKTSSFLAACTTDCHRTRPKHQCLLRHVMSPAFAPTGGLNDCTGGIFGLPRNTTFEMEPRLRSRHALEPVFCRHG